MRKEDEVHYIGGAEILPPPLEGEREAYCIRMLDGVHAERARKELIEHNLRLVVYIAKSLITQGRSGGSYFHRDDRSYQRDQYL